MKIIEKKNDLYKYLTNISNLGFVPTMGALHAGHLSLIRESQKICKKTLVSIFVNSTQFNNKKDFLNNLIVQIFVNNGKIFRLKVSEILNRKHPSKLRYFLTHHITNLEINDIAIDKFIKKRTRRIIVNCSGIMKEFITGSISQNIIYNSFTNC